MESIQQLINEEKSLLNGCRGWLFKETDPDRRQIIQPNTLLIESAKLRGEREMLCSKLNDSDKMDI
jgi:hypothetical protein